MKNSASVQMQAKAWHILWPILVELGVNEKCPDGTGLEAATEFVKGLVAERDAAMDSTDLANLGARDAKLADVTTSLEKAAPAPYGRFGYGEYVSGIEAKRRSGLSHWKLTKAVVQGRVRVEIAPGSPPRYNLGDVLQAVSQQSSAQLASVASGDEKPSGRHKPKGQV